MALVQQSFGAPSVAAAPAAPPSAAATASVRVATAGAPVSRLAQMQARFQKKQMEEKEQKLLRLYESQQQRAFQRVGRGSAGGSSTASLSSSTSTLASVGLGGGGGGGGERGAGKVRQLFEERRTNGWDRSYPLEPVAGGKTRPGPHPAQQTAFGQHAQQGLPLAVPKTKVARGASLDRSHAAPAPHAKSVARRSKSHARGEALHAANGLAPADAANKLYYDGGGHGFRKIPNNNHNNNNGHHIHNNNNNNHVEEYNNRNNYRRQQVTPPDDNYEDDFEDDVNYETLGDDVPRHARNGNSNFAVLPDSKRQEELFAKYQVRELGNHELLVNTSPPPDAYDDIDDGGTFIYEKSPNVGGPLRSDEPVNHNDRFKTYVSNKHSQRAIYKEEVAPAPAPAPRAMASKVQDAKKAPAARRESLSPPTRAAPAARPAPRKPQEKSSTGSKTHVKSPTGSISSTGSIAPKHSAGVTSRPTSSAINKNNYNNNTKPSPASSKMRNGPSSQTLRTAPSRDDLTECHICHRRFTNDRIKVHEEICSKTAQKKRKEYDATKHRVQGTEAEQFVKRSMKNGPQKKTTKCTLQVEPKKADWRKKHEEFIQTIRAAKEAQAHVAAGGKLSDLPPPPPLDTSDYIQCPHCGRRFNEAAAERHIPRCANMQHNKPKVPASKSSGSFCKRR